MLATPCVAAQEAVVPQSADLIDRAAGTVSIRGGLLFTEHRTIARVDSKDLGRGTTVTAERELGLSEWTRDVRFDASLRLGKRHQLQAGYLALTREGRRTIDRRIQFGDAVFDVEVGVESAVDLILVPVTYRFAPLRTDRIDLGLSAGVFALFLDAAVEAPQASLREAGSTEFPLPVVGVDAVVAVIPGLYATAGFKYFSLETGGVDGQWRELRVAVEYFPVKGIGVGAGHRFVGLTADGTEGIISRAEGSLLFLDYEFQGPHVYLTVVF